jgi:hypothetical protein
MEFTPHFCWGVPIVEVRNPDHAQIKPALVRLSYEDEQRHRGNPIASGVAPRAKTNLYESPFNFFHNPAPEVQALRQFCCTALAQAIYHLDQHVNNGANQIGNVIVNAFESWIHITRDGGSHDTHVHPNCSTPTAPGAASTTWTSATLPSIRPTGSTASIPRSS